MTDKLYQKMTQEMYGITNEDFFKPISKDEEILIEKITMELDIDKSDENKKNVFVLCQPLSHIQEKMLIEKIDVKYKVKLYDILFKKKEYVLENSDEKDEIEYLFFKKKIKRRFDFVNVEEWKKIETEIISFLENNMIASMSVFYSNKNLKNEMSNLLKELEEKYKLNKQRSKSDFYFSKLSMNAIITIFTVPFLFKEEVELEESSSLFVRSYLSVIKSVKDVFLLRDRVEDFVKKDKKDTDLEELVLKVIPNLNEIKKEIEMIGSNSEREEKEVGKKKKLLDVVTPIIKKYEKLRDDFISLRSKKEQNITFFETEIDDLEMKIKLFLSECSNITGEEAVEKFSNKIKNISGLIKSELKQYAVSIKDETIEEVVKNATEGVCEEKKEVIDTLDSNISKECLSEEYILQYYENKKYLTNKLLDLEKEFALIKFRSN